MPRMLSSADKRHFVEHGYLVRQLPFDAAVFARAIDLAWQHLDPQLVRDDPASWRTDCAITDSCHTRTMSERRGRVKLRECVHPVGWLGDVIHGDPRILEMVRDLLGPDAVPRRKIRGLYPVFPQPELEPRRHGGMDAHPFQVSCIVYLSDVEQGGGEFMVWPGSHRIMSRAFDGPYACKLNEQQRELRKQAEAQSSPVHLPGPAGTVILWHHRLLHGPNTNRGTSIRHALVGDFLRADWEARAGETHAAGMWSGWAVDDRLRAWPKRLGAFGRRLLGARAANAIA